MIRIIVFLTLVLAVALGLAWVAENEGAITVNWLGQTVELNILQGLAFLIAFTALVMLAWSLFRMAFRLPGLLALASRSRRKQKGYQAVAKGMVAVGSGDARTATRQAEDAARLLGQEPLTMLLSAQAAQLGGDAGKAQKAFNAMLENGDTRIVGLRGLHIEAERRSDPAAARFYADEAYKLAPGADWASEAALAYRCQDRDWLAAMAMVEQQASRRLITKDDARKKRATLLTADAMERGPMEADAAFRGLQEATRLDPALPAAAALVARKLSEKGDYAKASKLLEEAWKAMPHPDVAEGYLDVRIGDSAQDRLKRAKKLMNLALADPESRLAVARAALDAKEFRVARENLETLVLETPTVRACMLMAELEEAESGNMGLVREWLARASRAPRDKAWVADGKVSAEWLPVSPTGKIGGFVWTTPPQARGAVLLDAMADKPAA
ncbi:MAG: heme biosynthesis protein HemY, partial [Beijerinckiaceae bacterium]